MKNVVLEEVEIISEKDFKEYFKGRTIITKEEYFDFIKYKKVEENFNAIFNATPKKNYKKRRETIKITKK